MKNLASMLVIMILFSTIFMPIGQSVQVYEDPSWKAVDSWGMYCGMVNPGVFSVRDGYERNAVNIYYPTDIKDIVLGKRVFRVKEVTPTMLTLEGPVSQ
jgi:hypothetical protein